LIRGIAAFLVVGALIGGVWYLIYTYSHESTDDAYVTGTIVPIAPEIRGKVTAVYITDNQYVSAGAPLLEIFAQDYADEAKEQEHMVLSLRSEKVELEASLIQKQQALAQAEATLKAVLAQEDLAQKEYVRYRELVAEGAVPRNRYDEVTSTFKVATAQRQVATHATYEAREAIRAIQAKLATQDAKIKSAEARSRLTELNLKRTRLFAPISGRIAKKNVDPGKYVQPGQTLLAIVDPNTWVVANFKETQLNKMTVGQRVTIKVDAYPGVLFQGHVDSLQPGTGAVFSLLPPENATGNFVKVVQRLPVKILIDSPFDPVHPLWPGLSVIATVDVREKKGTKLSRP